MDGTTDQNSTPMETATPPVPTPQPQPTSPAGEPPIQATPKSPFPLKWALIGIALIVVLAGGILGIIGANNKQTAYTTETKAAGNVPIPTGVAWRFAALPNAMIECESREKCDILSIEKVTNDKGEETGMVNIHGFVIFATNPPVNSGAETWVIWASSDEKGKIRVGTTFPKGNAQLNEPKEPFPHPGTFTAGSSYPAKGDRKTGPAPSENQGVLLNATGRKDQAGKEVDIQDHAFHIYNVPGTTCPHVYLNYRSNRQGGNSVGNNSPMFYKITLPACRPTPTQVRASVTPRFPSPSIPIPSGPPVNVPPGCSVIAKYEAGNGSKNGDTCEETCGITKKGAQCDPGPKTAYYCRKQICRPGENNQYDSNLKGYSTYGNWYCCTSMCGKDCGTSLNCGDGLTCKDNKCVDSSTCAQSAGGCKCAAYPIVLPSTTPAP